MPLYKLQSRVVVYMHLHKIKHTNERRKHKIQTVQVKPHGSSEIIPAGENHIQRESRPSKYRKQPRRVLNVLQATSLIAAISVR